MKHIDACRYAALERTEDDYLNADCCCPETPANAAHKARTERGHAVARQVLTAGRTGAGITLSGDDTQALRTYLLVRTINIYSDGRV
jgi:hypothetical protein